MKKILPIIIVALFMVAAPAYAYEINGTLSTGGVAPATPTGLTTSKPVQGDSSIAIKWNPVVDINGYSLYRIIGTTTPVFVASTTSIGTSYTDTGLSNGTYSYQVESYFGTLTSEKSTSTTPVTIDTTAPSVSTPASSSSNGGSGGSYTPPTTSLKGDTNSDGVVNIKDFNTLITHWGLSVTGGATDGDFNSDGVVNIKDFNILITHWTQ